mgnify:CR=1 FL=1
MDSRMTEAELEAEALQAEEDKYVLEADMMIQEEE